MFVDCQLPGIEHLRYQLELELPTSTICNHIETRVCFALLGLGISCLPDFAVRGPLGDGRLRTVLDSHVAHTSTLRILWPASRHPAPKLRVFVDFLCPVRARVCRQEGEGISPA